jgi:cytochrome P450 family 6
LLTGHEGSAISKTYLLYEICKPKNRLILDKMHEEIDRVLAKYNGEVTYEALKEMTYLECCINEVSRKYPIGMPFRMCGKDYQIRDTNLTIEKGTLVFFPVLGIQRDPEYFENPLEFRPERFLTSPTGNDAPGMTYFPFGEGRRNCIGIRLAKIQMKIGLVFLLSKFTVELVDKEMIDKELEFDSKNSSLSPKTKIFMRLTMRK